MADFEINWNEIRLDHLLHSVDGPVGKDLTKRSLKVEAGQKRLLSQHGTGRVYTKRWFTARDGSVHERYGPGSDRKPHQASSPESPPATDYGPLRASIGQNVGHDAKGLRAHVGSGSGNTPGLKYAKYLEEGTHRPINGSIEPRPFIKPSAKYAE